MSTTHWTRCRWLSSGLVALALSVVAPGMLAGQVAGPTKEQAEDAAAFKEFSARVQEYVKLQKTVKSGLPTFKPTDLPEMIAAYQQALARKVREARPHAKPGDIFTPAACEAFRHASRSALKGPHSANSRTYMQRGEADPAMRVAVNGVYPDSEPITAFPPALLAAYPPLPVEVAYRIVGRTLAVIDVESRMIVDLARHILPPA
jgi:hypothetical protein